jgi:hypothetical protein
MHRSLAMGLPAVQALPLSGIVVVANLSDRGNSAMSSR